MPNAKVPFSKVPFSDLQDKPQGKWVDSIVGGLNESMLALSGNAQNIEIKQVDVTTPDPWISLSSQMTGDWLGYVSAARLYDGSVQIVGQIQPNPFGPSGGVSYGFEVLTLPQQIRPHSNRFYAVGCTGGTGVGTFTIGKSGVIVPTIGGGTLYINCRYMPKNNRPAPLSCFPVNVKTRFKTPPKAVVCLKNERVGQSEGKCTCTADMPSWRYINSAQGPVVQVIDIPGLEYGCRQRVTIAIIGG